MLPDYLSLKTSLMENLTGTMRAGVDADGVLAMVHHFTAHEGDGFVTEREDGTADEGKYRRFQHAIEISPHDIELRGVSAVKDVLREMQDALARSQHDALFDELKKATESVGTALDAGGKPFTAELWLDAMERMEFSFDPDGKWKPPTIVIAPGQRERVAQELARLDTDASLAARMESVIQQKRQEWRDREARRRLVD